MVRCSTPTHTFRFKFCPATDCADIVVTYTQNGEKVLEKRYGDMSFTPVDKPEIVRGKPYWFAWYTLTQEETQQFKAPEYGQSYIDNYDVEIQLRALMADSEGTVVTTPISRVPVFRVLNDEILGKQDEEF